MNLSLDLNGRDNFEFYTFYNWLSDFRVKSVRGWKWRITPRTRKNVTKSISPEHTRYCKNSNENGIRSV